MIDLTIDQPYAPEARSEMHQALMAYVKIRKDWDERSWK